MICILKWLGFERFHTAVVYLAAGKRSVGGLTTKPKPQGLVGKVQKRQQDAKVFR